MTDCVTIFRAVESKETADRIAHVLIERRLAACVQLAPIESYYRWEDAVQHAPELLLHIKTTAARFAAVEAVIKALHSYALPEIVALPIVAASADYRRWIEESVAPQ